MPTKREDQKRWADTASDVIRLGLATDWRSNDQQGARFKAALQRVSAWAGELLEPVAHPGGRPRDALYDEAFRIEQDMGQSAFAWFCEESGTRKPDKRFRDSYRAAMKRRMEKAL